MVRFFFQGIPSSITNVPTDLLAFLVIVLLVIGSKNRGFKMPHILRTIVQDSTVYFLVIFTSHFVLEMTLLLARVSVPILGDICATKRILVQRTTIAS